MLRMYTSNSQSLTSNANETYTYRALRDAPRLPSSDTSPVSSLF